MERTKGSWKSQGRTTTEEKYHARYQKLLAQYPVLNTEGYEHTKEQLYWMIRWHFSDETIKYLLSTGAPSQDIDFFRLLILLVDADYVKKHYIGHEFFYEDALKQLKAHMSGDQDMKNELNVLASERKRLEEKFQSQMDFMNQKFSSDKNLYEAELKHKEELYTLELKYMENEKQRLEEDNKSYIEQIESQKKELAGLKEMCQKAKTDIKHTGSLRTGIFHDLGGLLRRRRKRGKEQALVDAIKDTRFTIPQLKFLTFACGTLISTRDFLQLVNPEIPLQQMQILCELFFKKNNIQIPFPEFEDSDRENIQNDGDGESGSEEVYE